jgi:hypothetical protein
MTSAEAACRRWKADAGAVMMALDAAAARGDLAEVLRLSAVADRLVARAEAEIRALTDRRLN